MKSCLLRKAERLGFKACNLNAAIAQLNEEDSEDQILDTYLEKLGKPENKLCFFVDDLELLASDDLLYSGSVEYVSIVRSGRINNGTGGITYGDESTNVYI